MLDSSFPVLLPEFSAFAKLAADFNLHASAVKNNGLAKQHNVQEVTKELQALDTQGEVIATETKEVSLTTEKVINDLDTRRGVSHGHWKYLLNLVVLVANDQLRALWQLLFAARPTSGQRRQA